MPAIFYEMCSLDFVLDALRKSVSNAQLLRKRTELTNYTILIVEYDVSEMQKQFALEHWEAQARQIDTLPGLCWKYWLTSAESDKRGGVYLFSSGDLVANASNVLVASLADLQATEVTARMFTVDESLSAITRGQLPGSA